MVFEVVINIKTQIQSHVSGNAMKSGEIQVKTHIDITDW